MIAAREEAVDPKGGNLVVFLRWAERC